MKYTITRALAELKLLKERYNKEIRSLAIVAVKHGNKLRSPYSQYKEKDFIDQAKKSYQSVCDLAKRIEEIKNKIDISNFTTKVTIGGREMTIQEVLNYKNNILPLKETQLMILQDQKQRYTYEFERALKENESTISRISAEKNSGSGASKSASDVENDVVDFVEKAYMVSSVDPLQIDEEIKKLDKEISDFKHEIDFVLSESNSITTIDVDD